MYKLESSIKNEGIIRDAFNNDPEYNKHLCEKLKLETMCEMKDAKKENNLQAINTPQWAKYKKGTKEKSATSKTDKIIADRDKIIYTISMKNKKGRLTSSDCWETSAILLSVWVNKYPNNIYIKNIIDDILKEMKHLGKYKPKCKLFTMTKAKKKMKNNPLSSDEDILWVKKLLNVCEFCNKKWEELYNNHIEYIKDVLFECATGEYKFGDNCGRANILMITNGIKIVNIFNMEKRTKELDEYLLKCLPKSKKSIFACKTAGTGKEMWIRFL